VALLNILNFFAFSVLFNLAYSYTTAARGALTLSIMPLMTMLVGAALGIERLSRRKTLGVLIAMSGVFFALMLGLSGAPAGAWRGELVMLSATFCMSLYNVWSRPFIARSDPLAFLTAGMGAAAACLLVWALLIHGFDAVPYFSMPQWLAVAYLGVVGSAGAFILWVFALSRTSPTKTAVTITVNPVFASIVGALAIGEGIGLNLVAGLAAVAVGIWIATTASHS
jgi:drug/metabolite transporter (DMT)-like permease